jgi:hypothetical protein
MHIESMRKKLTNYLHVADDDLIKRLYHLLKDEICEELKYSEKLETQLNEAISYYRNGGEMVSAVHVKTEIEKLLKRNL